MIAAALALSLVALAALARRRWVVVTIDGHSMAPTFRDRQRVLARRAAGTRRCGEVIVFALSEEQRRHDGEAPAFRVKRVAAIAGDPVPGWMSEARRDRCVPDGCVVVVGDNPHSQDSRQLGYIAVRDIIATVPRAQGGT